MYWKNGYICGEVVSVIESTFMRRGHRVKLNSAGSALFLSGLTGEKPGLVLT